MDPVYERTWRVATTCFLKMLTVASMASWRFFSGMETETSPWSGRTEMALLLVGVVAALTHDAHRVVGRARRLLL